ncbi:MAG: patatin-like phospholipase family protein [Acetobacteraceae bacterium]|nr:patatin-like phospholipase family protein [Acetobacteraceae bacterium]
MSNLQPSEKLALARNHAPEMAGVARHEEQAGPRQGRERLALALQGGGSFGSFTWGVLDRLLDEPIDFDIVSGTSAGALNAVLLADGLAEGGPEAAKRKLAHFWKRVSDLAPLHLSTTAIELTAPLTSPYLFNPLGLNPLRDLLTAEIDFERLRADPPLGLMIAATRVSDGRLRLFREHEITLEAVLASCCLPRLHHAVEIDGEAYWDGGFSANPPLRPLALETDAEVILLVQLLAAQSPGVPRRGAEITQRLSGIAFNEPLLKELEALDDLCALCREQKVLRSKLCRRILRLRVERITADSAVPGLDKESPLHADWALLTRLHQAGIAAADGWLAARS